MRKFRLNLILANQHLGQFADYPKVLAAILGNAGSLIAFRTGAQDAQVLQEEFFPRIDKRDLVRLGKYQVFLKLMIEGVASEGFGAGTLQALKTVRSGPRKDKQDCPYDRGHFYSCAKNEF